VIKKELMRKEEEKKRNEKICEEEKFLKTLICGKTKKEKQISVLDDENNNDISFKNCVNKNPPSVLQKRRQLFSMSTDVLLHQHTPTKEDLDVTELQQACSSPIVVVGGGGKKGDLSIAVDSTGEADNKSPCSMISTPFINSLMISRSITFSPSQVSKMSNNSTFTTASEKDEGDFGVKQRSDSPIIRKRTLVKLVVPKVKPAKNHPLVFARKATLNVPLSMGKGRLITDEKNVEVEKNFVKMREHKNVKPIQIPSLIFSNNKRLNETVVINNNKNTSGLRGANDVEEVIPTMVDWSEYDSYKKAEENREHKRQKKKLKRKNLKAGKEDLCGESGDESITDSIESSESEEEKGTKTDPERNEENLEKNQVRLEYNRVLTQFFSPGVVGCMELFGKCSAGIGRKDLGNVEETTAAMEMSMVTEARKEKNRLKRMEMKELKKKEKQRKLQEEEKMKEEERNKIDLEQTKVVDDAKEISGTLFDSDNKIKEREKDRSNSEINDLNEKKPGEVIPKTEGVGFEHAEQEEARKARLAHYWEQGGKWDETSLLSLGHYSSYGDAIHNRLMDYQPFYSSFKEFDSMFEIDGVSSYKEKYDDDIPTRVNTRDGSADVVRVGYHPPLMQLEPIEETAVKNRDGVCLVARCMN
jgi:hypothetical protein